MSLILPPELEQYRSKLEGLNQNNKEVVYVGDNNPNLGWKDQNGDFHPAGSKDSKDWVNIKTNALYQIVSDYASKGVKEGVIRQIAMGLYRNNPQMPTGVFVKTVQSETERYYNEHKEEIENAIKNEKEYEELISGKVQNEESKNVSEGNQRTSLRTPPHTSASLTKLVKLDGGVIFSMDDFENLLSGKLKLKSLKKPIVLNEKQLEQLTSQL